MAESARAGPTDLNGAGPSRSRITPPWVSNPDMFAVRPLSVLGHMKGPESSSVNATTITEETRPQPTDIPSTTTTKAAATSRMDPPPDIMRPPSRGSETPNGVHFASTTESITNPDPIGEADQPMSPAQSIAGSTSTSKSRNKRKRAPVATARRASTVETIEKDLPAHYLGPHNQEIRCICDTQSESLTAQCETCGAWEHVLCFGYPEIEAALPEHFYCELCDPRPVDPATARAIQLEWMKLHMFAPDSEPDPVKPRPKGRRQKSEIGPNDGDDPSPTTAKPPSLPNKPKRRQTGGKPPRSAKASITDTAPSPAAAAASIRAVASEAGKELDDPFFRDPWVLQFSPLDANLSKGSKGQAALKRLREEWQDAPLEDAEDSPAPDKESPESWTPNGNGPTPDPVDLTDFSPLAAPIPPVSLLGPDIDALGAQVVVKPVRDSINFLPDKYEGDLSPDDLSHPSNYAIYAKNEIPAGTFIGEFRGEVGPSEAYRRDKYNQYGRLGVPKPHVRFIGPPVNLAIDARSWGTNLRFIRSSCHPNAVLRLIRWRRSESDPPQIGFGLFATTAIRARAEITLSWEWDDTHLVHSLRRIITAAASDEAHLPREESADTLAEKCELALLAMYGVFATCACTNLHHCAFHQMKYLVDHRELDVARRFGSGSSHGRNTDSELGELIGAVRGFRRQEPVAQYRPRRRSPGWGMETPTVPVVPMAEKEEEAVSGGNQEDAQESMEVDTTETAAAEPAKAVDSPGQDVEMDQPVEDRPEPETEPAIETPQVESTALPTIPETTPLNLQPPAADVTPRTSADQDLLNKVVPSSVASSILSAAPSQEVEDPSAQAPQPNGEALPLTESVEVEMNGNESDATTATLARSTFSDSDPESEDDRPSTPPRRSVPPAPTVKKEKVVKQNGKLKKDKPAPVHLSDLFENDTGRPQNSPAVSSTSDLPDGDEIVAEPDVQDSPPRRSKIIPSITRGRPKSAKKKETKPAKIVQLRKPIRQSKSRSESPLKTATPKAEPVEEKKKEPTPEPVKEPTPEPVKEPTPEPVKEPTPPPPPKPKQVVSITEYLRQSRQRKEETANPVETPVAPPTPAAVEQPIAPVVGAAQPKVNPVDDGGIPGFKHMSPLKPADPLPVINGSSASPATRQVELDNSRLNMNDYLPSHGSAAQTPALETPTNGSTSTTPGLGLTKGDYFPQQPSGQANSSSYVPRASISRPSYVPRAQGSISRTSESPSIDDYLPRPGSSSAQSTSSPLPRIPSGSAPYVPRPSPLNDHVPLPPAMSQSTSSSSSTNFRVSPYRPPPTLPAVVEPSIPPPAVREPPPHATFRPPPTGPKVPPKGPRTSGGSASGGFVPPRDRDRDWDARDRERDRDRDRDRERERERDRDRDREPVSPRATFGVGSARGGAPVPVPFHRPRGRGQFRPAGRGGRPQ